MDFSETSHAQPVYLPLHLSNGWKLCSATSRQHQHTQPSSLQARAGDTLPGVYARRLPFAGKLTTSTLELANTTKVAVRVDAHVS